jgi:hypothetical protein
MPINSFSGDKKGLGISYDQIMNNISDYFVMKKDSVDGQDRYMGQSNNKLMILEIIGKKQNVNQVSLILPISDSDPKALVENTAVVLIFLKNILPTYPKAYEWVLSTTNKREKVYDNKVITVIPIKQLGSMSITATPK